MHIFACGGLRWDMTPLVRRLRLLFLQLCPLDHFG